MSGNIFKATVSAIALTVAAGGATMSAATDTGTIAPKYGDIDPFYGDIDPFYGDIDPFYGDIDPFYGNIEPFYGDINPFYGDIEPFYGDINPFYGDIEPFWGYNNPLYGDIDPFYGDIAPFWEGFGKEWRELRSAWEQGASGGDIQAGLTALLDNAKSVWSDQLESRGVDFDDDIVATVFAKNGLDLNDAASFEAAGKGRREKLVMDLYDALMDHSGRNRVDHWMGTVNWSPGITQDQSSGGRSTIGIIDGAIEGDKGLLDNLVSTLGLGGKANGHGAGVASLVVGEHDGEGVMGIAPRARVLAYNPYDDSGTADWSDITTGIGELSRRGASVINLSLGESGKVLGQNWDDVFGDVFADSRNHATRLNFSGVVGFYKTGGVQNTVFVKAAGNDGVAQENDIDWDKGQQATLLVVGSVDPTGKISRFSNTPGDACLLVNGKCGKDSKLMDHFLVAPGEQILVNDGMGGTTRQSGTSLSAPLVSGAITLMHDRWNWLAGYSEETAQIILQTATDLGDKGVDEVYGHGLLNVEASQSPIDYSKLTTIQIGKKGLEYKSLKKAKIEGTLPTWSANSQHIHAFEAIGDTHRDFLIPLTDKLYGKKKRLFGFAENFQSFLADDFWDYWNDDDDDDDKKGKKDRKGKKDKKDRDDFTDVRALSFASAGMDVTVKSTSTLRFTDQGSGLGPSHNEIGLNFGKTQLKMGHGVGVMALSNQSGFGMTQDHVEGRSGVNPVLGFASGGGFIGALHEIDPFIAFSGGLTSAKVEHGTEDGISAADRQAFLGLDDYEATGLTFGVHLTPSDDVNVSLSYTRLKEDSAILGVQSQIADDIDGGSASDALTLGIDANLPHGFQLAASATASKTTGGDSNQLISVADGGIMSTAFAASVTKNGIFGTNDLMRLTVSQPLHIEAGSLELNQGGIIDRSTGEIGLVTSRFSIAGDARPLNAEFRYATPVMKAGTFSLYGRGDSNMDGIAGRDAVSLGARFKIGF
ncbi:MAG: S8 family serine peptidase [Pacificimonas sp.]